MNNPNETDMTLFIKTPIVVNIESELSGHIIETTSPKNNVLITPHSDGET